MVAERLDIQPSTDGTTSKQARFAAEASIRAALRLNNRSNNRSGDPSPEAETRKSKKKKRNRKRGRERNITLANVLENPAAMVTLGEQPGAVRQKQEFALDLGTIHEGEIDMRNGAVHVVDQLQHETPRPYVSTPQETAESKPETFEVTPAEILQPKSMEQIKKQVAGPTYESPANPTHDAPPVPPGFQEFSQVLNKQEPGQKLPEQYAPPILEATPLHDYPTEETSRTTVTPISVETRRPSGQLSQEAGKSETAAGDMSRSELLKVAKTITIDGVKLKDIFDAKRLDEEGLRAVVETYLRGGDVKRKLTEEVVAKEQSFERDPFLRHQRQQAGGKLSTVAVNTTAIATAGIRRFVDSHAPQLTASSKKNVKKAKQILVNGAKHAHQDIIDNSNTTDWLSITAIVIIWSLILFLLVG